MAYVSKIFGLRVKHFQCNAGGKNLELTGFGIEIWLRILATFHANVKSFSASSDVISQLKSSSYVNTKRKSPSNIPFVADAKKKGFYKISKFSKLNLKMIVQNAGNLREGAVLSLFHKILSVYFLNKDDAMFHKDLKKFSKSVEFNNFCKILNATLPSLPPNTLIDFLYLEHLEVRVQNPVMKKILFLIHENIHCFYLPEVLEIYVTLKKPHFAFSEICQDILHACESYFENSFEDELSHYQNIYELVYYLHEEDLPLSVRKLLVEKFFGAMERNNYRISLYIKLFDALFQEPFISLYKPQILKLLKNTINVLATTLSLTTLSSFYETAVHKDDNFYDEEVCNALAKQTCAAKIFILSGLKVTQNLCLMGYLNYDLISYFANNISQLLPDSALNVASIFTRTSFHEQNHNDWDKIKQNMIKVDAIEMFPNMSDLIKWCEYLTFLGCDTRALLSHIFNTFNSKEKDLITSDKDNLTFRQVLTLHHFAQAHVSDDYDKLTKKTLNRCVEKAKLKDKFLQRFCLREVLESEDFFLNNCTTSSQHLIPAVILLGADNKPINLSSYKAQDMTYLKSKNNFRNFQVYNIDKIKKPPGSKMIVFQPFLDRQPFEFRNAPIKSGIFRIFLKSIENISSNVVVLQDRFFYKTSEEKCQFIKSKINEIIESPEGEDNRIIF